MIDMHCHLDLYPSPMSVVDEAAKQNFFTLAVTTSPRAWQATDRVFRRYSNIKVALGLHPEIVTEKASEKGLLIELISKTEFIGEIGLDGSRRFKGSFDLQKEIFESAILECAKQGGKVISIHSRRAEEEVLDIIASNPTCGIPILHWYSGSVTNLKRAIDLGCWFSVGPAMLRSKSNEEIVQKIPLERLLPESDGPFARDGANPIMPWQAIKVAEQISFLRGWTLRELERQLEKNLLGLLGRKA